MTRQHAWRIPFAAVWLAIAVVGGASAETRVFELTIKDARLPEGQRLIRVRQGDEVTLKWTADRSVTLHLHGYDIEARVAPPTPVEMRFTASATGRFPIEIHAQTHATIGHLEVHPR
jgi:FtsP/CotA-like multicopper oxidase with cupredoxin domain